MCTWAYHSRVSYLQWPTARQQTGPKIGRKKWAGLLLQGRDRRCTFDNSFFRKKKQLSLDHKKGGSTTREKKTGLQQVRHRRWKEGQGWGQIGLYWIIQQVRMWTVWSKLKWYNVKIFICSCPQRYSIDIFFSSIRSSMMCVLHRHKYKKISQYLSKWERLGWTILSLWALISDETPDQFSHFPIFMEYMLACTKG